MSLPLRVCTARLLGLIAPKPQALRGNVWIGWWETRGQWATQLSSGQKRAPERARLLASKKIVM